MKHIAIDLELNQPSGKIIQVGWAIGSLIEDDVIDKGSIYINPGEPISEYITKLTGISDKDTQNAEQLVTASLRPLFDLVRQPDVFRVPLTWGGGDMSCLKQQLNIQSTDMMMQGKEPTKEDWPFARSEWDIKKIWQFYRLAHGLPIQGGLSKSMTKIGLSFKGRKHTADDDALNTLRFARKLITILKYDVLKNPIQP